MAHKIIWLLQGDDLRAIVAFIAADNPTVAESFGYQAHVQSGFVGELSPTRSCRAGRERREHSRADSSAIPNCLSRAANETGDCHRPHLAWRARRTGSSEAVGILNWSA